MRIDPQISGVGIVALGNFNPLIFRPDWFKEKEIVVGGDFDGCKIDIIHPEVSAFRVPWGQMHVDRDRFSIVGNREPIIRVFDFFVKTFQYLPETPIKALGINRDVHFNAGSVSAWDSVGDALAPKSFWGDFVKTKDGEKGGGLRTLTMEQGITEGGRTTRLDGLKGWVRVQVEPSLQGVPHGIYVLVNDHYDLVEADRPSDGRKATELVLENWDKSLTVSESLIDRIMELASVT